LLAAVLATGCATRAPAAEEDADIDEPVSQGGTLGLAEGVTGTAWAEMSAPPKAGELKPDDLQWEIFRVPGKQSASYSYVRHDGRDAVLAKAEASGSILRHRHRIEPDNSACALFLERAKRGCGRQPHAAATRGCAGAGGARVRRRPLAAVDEKRHAVGA
jgi:streptogramin lyase